MFFVRFLLYVVYVFALYSPYLEDNKVSIYLLCFESIGIKLLKELHIQGTHYLFTLNVITEKMTKFNLSVKK